MKAPLSSVTVTKSLLIIFYTSAAIVQSLVISKVIPFSWVNGGMSKSYETQVVQSIVSLIIILCLFTFTLRLATKAMSVNKWGLKILYGITVFWGLGLLMQLAGTNFERYVLSFSLLLGLVSHILLIQQVRFRVSTNHKN